jgi:hypothetical protein
MIAGSKTTGRGTSYSATRFIRTHRNTSRCFVDRNWVNGFRCVCDSCWTDSYRCFLHSQFHFPILFVLRQCCAFFVCSHRAACVAPICCSTSSLPPCMQILPLVEMFCWWELEEDCSDLRALMGRFDSESDLESHELGRSLLCMLRYDDTGMHRVTLAAAIESTTNLFGLVRQRLAAAGVSIRGLQHQVGMPVPFFYASYLLVAFQTCVTTTCAQRRSGFIIHSRFAVKAELYCLPWCLPAELPVFFTEFRFTQLAKISITSSV